LSLLSDFRQSTIHQLEETGGKETAGSSSSSSSSSRSSGGGGDTFINSPTMIQLSWTIAYYFNCCGRMLFKALNGDDDRNDDDGEEDDDDDREQEQDNRIVDVHNALQAIHTASIHDHHHLIKMNDVKKLENALGDIVLQVFFFGIISDEVDTEV